MNSDHTISIVIPVYNSEDSIADSIQAALQQDYPAVEVIVVDDCSGDGTREVCRQFGNQITFVSLPVNSGGSVARNMGASLASGSYLAFLDADDIFFPEKIRVQLGYMKAGNSRFSYCGAKDELGNFLGAPSRKEFWTDLLLGDCDIVSSSGLMVAKDLHDEINGFNESFRRQQDIEYSIRLSQVSTPLFVPEALYLKKNSGSPSLNSVLQGINSVWQYFENEICNLDKTCQKRIKARGYIRFAELALKEGRIGFLRYLLKAIYLDPLVVGRRLHRYVNRMKLKLKPAKKNVRGYE